MLPPGALFFGYSEAHSIQRYWAVELPEVHAVRIAKVGDQHLFGSICIDNVEAGRTDVCSAGCSSALPTHYEPRNVRKAPTSSLLERGKLHRS